MAHATSPPRRRPPPLTLHGLSVEGVNQCVHCGLCLASCPTFSELGTEMDSPRGRIFLIKSLAEGRIGLSDSDRRAPVAVSGLPGVRDRVPGRRPVRPSDRGRQGGDRAPAAGWSSVRRAFRWLNFGLLLGHPRVLGAAAAGLAALPGERAAGARAAHRARAAAAGHAAGVGGAAAADAAGGRAGAAAAAHARRGRAARRAWRMLTGCVQSVVFGAHNRATARVLARNGWDVVAPAAQGCCGALNAHGGDHARRRGDGQAHDRDLRGGAAPRRWSSTRRAAART